MADAILSTLSNETATPNPATEAKAKPTTPPQPPKGIPFPTGKKVEREIDLRTIEGIVAKHLGYRILEGKSFEEALAAGHTKARELINQLVRQNAKSGGSPYREASNFLKTWCEEAGIVQFQECILAHNGRLIATEPFHASVSRIAKLIKEVSGGQVALSFVEQAKAVRGGRDGRRLLEEPKYLAIIKSLIS
jgi:hypothetical protein